VTEGFGLMFYVARFYDSQLGRFVSADSIIPGGVQGPDRYAAMANSPVMYVDPSGHETVLCDEECEDNDRSTPKLVTPESIDSLMDIKDDPVELLTRVLMGEEGYKLLDTKYIDDVWGVAWAIRNRHDSGYYATSGRGGRGDYDPTGEYNWYWSASSGIYGGRTQRALDPLGSGAWGDREETIAIYTRV